MSKLAVGSLEGLASEGYKITVASGSTFAQTGSVLQVLSTTKTDTFSTTSATFSDVTGLSVTITPKFATSKIFIQASGQGSTDGSGASGMRLLRDSTDICIGDTAGNRARITNAATSNAFGGWAFQFLDSPSTTSATTYKIQIASLVNSRIHGINRCFDDSDFIYRPRGTSTITVMEIAG
jgi:hypothetical protein